MRQEKLGKKEQAALATVGRPRTYSMLVASRRELEAKCLAGIAKLARSVEAWTVLPFASWVHRFRSISFNLLSSLACAVFMKHWFPHGLGLYAIASFVNNAGGLKTAFDEFRDGCDDKLGEWGLSFM